MTFIDTSVLVHSAATQSPDHLLAKSALSRALSSGRLSLSRQIIRCRILEDGEPVWEELVVLGRSHNFAGKQVHDAHIVATMLAHGETRILTFNEKHFRRFTPLIDIVTP